MSRRSLVGRMYDLDKLKASNAAKPAPAAKPASAGPSLVLSEEPCFFCGVSSDRSHPGGVITRRWKCYSCSTWQPDARPQPAKVITEAEIPKRDLIAAQPLDVLEAPALLDLEEAQ